MGEPASEQCIALCKASVGLFNKAFEDGRENRKRPNIKKDFIDACKRDGTEELLNDENVLHIVASASWWCEEAYRQGKEAVPHD